MNSPLKQSAQIPLTLFARFTGYQGGSGFGATIPNIIDGYPVMSTGDRAFEFFSAPESIVIPNSVTSIGKEAFTVAHS